VHHGRIEWEQLGGYLASADLGIALYQPLPSYLYYPGENVVKLFEYMKMGIPVLISNFQRLKPFIKNIGAGIAVDPANPSKIAGAIRYCYYHPDECRKMGKRGIEAVETRYNWEHEERKLTAVYQQVLSK
jgi:glycosyltransferase involved in cell wall biosynthesis